VAWRLHARLRGVLRRSETNRGGATGIEYGLLAAGIAVAIIVAIELLGFEIAAVFEAIRIEFAPGPANRDVR
jgi:pilus assembly protein Flp/PilA